MKSNINLSEFDLFRENQKKGYYYNGIQSISQKHLPEKIHCSVCGKEIPQGYPQKLRYGVGIVCKECSDKARII